MTDSYDVPNQATAAASAVQGPTVFRDRHTEKRGLR